MTMKTTLRDIFAKPVDRAIEGVIKADDETSLRLELEEYVITNEIEKQLERFLEAYNNYETANGVWVSGLFGSGKSHLLKMLAILLENRKVDGIPAHELFKGKCVENEILAADLGRAVSLPSKSILFNIDQQADVISKTQVDALLSVFQKVFDNMCGYYGKQPHIAQFERDLDSRGILGDFRDAYQRITNKPWELGREQALLEGANIWKAYAEASGTDLADGNGILNRYRQDFRSSIEDFAQKVSDYIDGQSPDFRLNFFVDEVGQYIADNVKLMTNLQTIAESLNTKCRGRAWIIVTAQQDMSSVIGDMTQRQENDFSKIQARFANRIPLNSADVAEVIQKRLLTKTDDGIELLSDLFRQESNNLKTLFDFSDGSRRYRNFRDRDHFIHSYPFVPYQYELFQDAIQNLSTHNAFEGKHSSVGERSMLGVFREAAIRLTETPIGGVATFDQMFEGIRTALKANVQQSILSAEKNLGDEFATRVLKALFLVKYVKAFKPSTGNISILMLDRLDVDLDAHRTKVEAALNLLEQNTYIQRNGEFFEFLTDEEKDVEQEIKSIDVDSAELSNELEKVIFDNIIKQRKLRHEVSSSDYSFSRRLDDRLIGREYELSINVVTPFHDDGGNPETVRMRTMSNDELAIVLQEDARFVSDLIMFKRTEKYVRQARAVAQQPTIERIIREKGEQNNVRQRDLIARAKSLLTEASMFIRGEELSVRADDPQARVERAFQQLVDKVYTNLGMLRGVSYTEGEIGKFLRQGNDGMFAEEGASLGGAEQEILNFTQSNARTGVRTTVKGIVEHFERKPYGWPYAAILCNVAGLIGRGKLEAKSEGAPIEGGELERGLKNAHGLSNIILDLQVEFTPSQVRKLREFYIEFFDDQPESSDAKALATETAAAFSKLANDLKTFEVQRNNYPFLSALNALAGLLGQVTEKAYDWYLTDLTAHAETLLDAKEEVLDPIRRFMGGQQKSIYVEARSYLEEQKANFSYLGTDDASAIVDILADPNCFKGNVIKQMKNRLDSLRATLESKICAEQEAARTEIRGLQDKLEALPEFPGLTDQEKQTISAEITTALAAVDQARLIAVIREKVNSFKSIQYPDLLGRVTAKKPKPTNDGKADGFGEKPITPPQTEYVQAANVRVDFDKPYLTDETDVDAYVDRLRETLTKEVRAGKRIIV